MPRLRPATSQTPNAEEQKKAAAIAAAAEAKRLKEEAEKNGEEIEEEPEIEEEGDDQNEAMTALQKQIEELKKSEEIQRNLAQQAMRDREEALKRSREREVEVRSHMKEASQAKLDAITSGIATAKAEAAAAERDIEAATQIGDVKAAAEAYRRLARAESNLGRLEDGKAQAEEQVKAEAEAAKNVTTKSEDPVDKMDVPDTIKTWLRAHPDYLADQRKNAKLQAFHWDVLDEGHAFGSDAYIESMETHLGIRKKPPVRQETEEEEDEPSGGNGRIVSAPVSRETPNNAGIRPSGNIRLNAAQREAAKNAGISEAEYAKQLKKLQEMRANGTYDGER